MIGRKWSVLPTGHRLLRTGCKDREREGDRGGWTERGRWGGKHWEREDVTVSWNLNLISHTLETHSESW